MQSDQAADLCSCGEKSEHRPGGHRLPGSRLSHERERLAGGDAEADVLHDVPPVVSPGERHGQALDPQDRRHVGNFGRRPGDRYPADVRRLAPALGCGRSRRRPAFCHCVADRVAKQAEGQHGQGDETAADEQEHGLGPVDLRSLRHH